LFSKWLVFIYTPTEKGSDWHLKNCNKNYCLA